MSRYRTFVIQWCNIGVQCFSLFIVNSYRLNRTYISGYSSYMYSDILEGIKAGKVKNNYPNVIVSNIYFYELL